MSLPRLDILLYAHDGRGLGHISRCIAIGLSIRRLFPELRIAVITGSPFAQMLADQLPLEIIKLPSYQVKIQEGESYGAKSYINFTDQQLAKLRSELIASVVTQTKPQCILVDHLPLGKRDELWRTQKENSKKSLWLLGARAVLGNVIHAQPVDCSGDLLGLYRQIFWYGDSMVIPQEQETGMLSRDMMVEPVGYVSRAYELEKWGALQPPHSKRSGCIVAFSWLTEDTVDVLHVIADLAELVGRRWGDWRVFLGRDYSKNGASAVINRLNGIHCCSVEKLSDRYLQVLATSSLAIVAGGYNTLTDLIWARTPAVVFVRPMADKEQSTHVTHLCNTCDGMVSLIEHGVTPSMLEEAMQNVFRFQGKPFHVEISGSEVTATRVKHILDYEKNHH